MVIFMNSSPNYRSNLRGDYRGFRKKDNNNNRTRRKRNKKRKNKRKRKKKII